MGLGAGLIERNAVALRGDQNGIGIPSGSERMRTSARLGTAGAIVGFLLSACASTTISPEDRKLVCRASVEGPFGAPVVQPHPLSNPAGAAGGAGAGALEGAATGAISGAMQGIGAALGVGAGMIVYLPLGLVAGALCAAGSLQHPTASADFERILRAADMGVLTRALEAELNAPRSECAHAATDDSVKAAPDAVVHIENITATMGCLYGSQEYSISVGWHATVASTGRVLKHARSGLSKRSRRSVDDWFAHADQAREEIEGVLATVGKQIAIDLLRPQP